MAQVIVSGIVLGGIYAFIALGFAMTWRTTRTLSFAQGELVTLGALLGLSLNQDMGLPLWLVIPVTLLAGALLAVVIQKLAIAPFAISGEKGVLGWVLGTVAVSILLRNIYELIWGLEPRRWRSPFGDGYIGIGPVNLQPQQLAILTAVAILALVSGWILTRTMWGKAFNAVAQNPDAAALSGISPNAVSTVAFAISGALAAFAGILLAPVTLASAHMGFGLVVSAFAVAVLAGLMSMRGALAVGLVFGAFEALVARFLGSELREIAGLLLLVAILMIRPNGIFGRAKVVKV
nr:branched-chain amino acid ABC transporter permease [Actinomycetales bacterium]